MNKRRKNKTRSQRRAKREAKARQLSAKHPFHNWTPEQLRHSWDTICPLAQYTQVMSWQKTFFGQCIHKIIYGSGSQSIMEIAIIHEDESENELSVDLCCEQCASTSYGWTPAQFNAVLKLARLGSPFKVPDNILSSADFAKFVKTATF